MFPLLGGLIGAGSSLLGGFLNSSNQQSMNAQNIAAQEMINSQNIQFQQAQNAQNIAEQEKFAQSGVQWRVQDAVKAGINPLAALGAQTASFSNQVAPQASALPSQQASNPGSGLASAGQNLARAMQSMQSPEDRAISIEKTRLDLEKSQLENDYIKSQIFNSNVRTAGAGIGPGLRTPKDPGPVDPSEVVATGPGGAVSGPSRTAEGWSWSNPYEKWYYGNRELGEWLGRNIPPDAVIPGVAAAGVAGHVAKNPFTGRYYDRDSAVAPLDAAWDWYKRHSGGQFDYSGVGTSAVAP